MPPKRKAPSQASAENDSDSEDDYEPSSQASGRKGEKLSRDMMKKLVNQVTEYILITDQRKHPIKRADITKNVISKEGNAGRCFPKIIEEVQTKLSNNFGVKLMKVPHDRQEQYIVVNLLPSRKEILIRWSDEEKASAGLLFYIQTVIFMNGGTVDEDTLWGTLKRMGLDPEKNNEEFGDVRRQVNEFVKQLYLEATPIPESNPTKQEYRWGFRSNAETNKMKFLMHVCKLLGGCDPMDWQQQYQEAQDQQSERENDEAL